MQNTGTQMNNCSFAGTWKTSPHEFPSAGISRREVRVQPKPRRQAAPGRVELHRGPDPAGRGRRPLKPCFVQQGY
jgi:hypothetical protein